MRKLFGAMSWVALANMVVPIVIPMQAEAAAKLPGPSKMLFDNPYYACSKNYYVSLSGSDANDGATPQTPWLTLQHANDVGRTAGDCVNVAPGTYAHGVDINHGGNLAAKTGYVVYRCQTMDACIVTDVNANYQQGSFVWNTQQPMGGSYVIIDGFTMRAAAETLYGQGIELWDGGGGQNAPLSVHHVWIINSIISGYGQSGIQMNDGEYFYVVHNTIYNNSNAGCSAQGSGISFVALKAFTNYVRTPDDSSNKMVGQIGSFNNAMEMNVLYNNATTQCGSQNNPYDSDGNNIIADTFNNAGGTNIPYPGSTLIAFNITYNAGGRGIHIFRSGNVTVANNSCYNSDLDPYDNATYRPCIGDNDSYNNQFFNNISYSISGSGYLAYNDAFVGGNDGVHGVDSFSNNISECIGNPPGGCTGMYGGDVFSCAANQCGVNPTWVNVGTQSTGTETSQPVGANFALAAGSPAIGKGLTKPYLFPQSVDVGACPSTVSICPRSGSQP